MKKNYLVFFFCICSAFLFGQRKQWQLSVDEAQNLSQDQVMRRNDMPKKYTIYTLKANDFKAKMASIKKNEKQLTEIPTSNGIKQFHVQESSNFSIKLAEKFPQIKTFTGTQVDNSSIKVRFTQGADGLHFTIYEVGKPTYYVDTYTKDNQHFIAYERTELQKEIHDFSCELKEISTKSTSEIKNKNANDGLLRTYDLALACTGEYAQFHLTRLGIPNTALDSEKKAAVLSAMNTTMNRVNGIFERDLSVSFKLINTNDQFIFLDETTDGFTNTNAEAIIAEAQTLFDSTLTNAGYDIGHTFSTGAGGVAKLGSVCVQGQKGQGATGTSSPFGDAFDIDFVAHEIGHQMGSNHTFNGTAGSCGATGQRNNATAVEPGSGSTIMAYAGICSPQNVQNVGDDHFHSVSITEMWNIVQSSGNCATTIPTGNNAPTANAGLDYAIPKSTPFVLRGVGTDLDANNTLTYNWEQIDNEIGYTIPPVSTNFGGAMFQSLSSATTPNRYMPALATVILGNTSSTWEVVPSVARDLNFSFVVRDNNTGGGGSAKDEVTISVVDAEPFLISSQNSAVLWNTGTSQTISWNVGTTNEMPINCQFVNIKLSLNGGITFPIMLASTIANDGNHTIIVPDNATTNARIMVEAADNIFYDVNNATISINSVTPTFIIDNTSSVGEVCNTGGDTVSYALDLNFVNGFSENVSFTSLGAPTNAMVTFSPTTINANGIVIMQITNLDGVTPQDYAINISAISNSVTQNIEVDLKVFSNSFAAIALTTPANSASNVSLTPTLNWNAISNTSAYEIQVALDHTFTNIVSMATTQNNSFIPNTLQETTTYFWRVKPINDCKDGNFSNTYSFTTKECNLCTSVANTLYETSTTLVNFNTINNISGKPSGYSNYTAISTEVNRGSSYNLTVNTNTADEGNSFYSTQTLVWIDWNQNCSFNDVGEQYNLGTVYSSVNGKTTLSPLSVEVPNNAILGNTIMRVTTKYTGDGAPTACENNADAEVEDYTLIVQDNPASVVTDVFTNFKLFPNPTKGTFNVAFETWHTAKVSIQLFDVRGRLVGEKNYFNTSTNFSETIYFDKTAAGLYLVRISNGSATITKKLMIK